MAEEVEVPTESTGENPENPDYGDNDEEDVKGMMRMTTRRRWLILSGRRKQLFSYL